MNTELLRLTYESNSPEETLALGEIIGQSLVGDLVIGLVGPLGAGKTQLVKGLAKGNAGGTARSVTSPTFTLIHEYSGRLTLHHVDTYRLRGPNEVAALGFDELIDKDSAVVVEWADRVRSLIPTCALWISIEPTGESTRRFTMEAVGDAASQCLTRLDTWQR